MSLEQLTPAQEIELREWRKRYYAIGWSTERSDRPKAEKAMVKLYARMGLPAPAFHWCQSPFEAVKIIEESTGSKVALSGTDGCLDAYWVAFHTFCIHLGGKVEPDDKVHLEEWKDLVESTGPCYPYTKVCLMTERPIRACWDEREVLHSEDGMALEYADGNGIYCIHNVVVPEMVVMRPWEMTLEMIEGEKNADVQTVMQDMWCHEEKDSTGRRKGAGGGRWLEETGSKAIDMDVYTAYTDEVTGESTQIQRALMEDKLGRKFLVCSDSSTDRVYFIQVANEAKTCVEGHASINGGIPDADIVVSA
jgi:hypothetical protein